MSYKIESTTSVNKKLEIARDEILTSSSGRYITSNSAGGSFPNEGALTGATKYYYNEEEVLKADLRNNDFAYVADSGSINNNEAGRYTWTGDIWAFQYSISSTLTRTQLDAINSGVTKNFVNGLAKASDLGRGSTRGLLRKSTTSANSWILDNEEYQKKNETGLMFHPLRTNMTTWSQVQLGGSLAFNITVPSYLTGGLGSGSILYIEVALGTDRTNTSAQLINVTLPTSYSTSGGVSGVENTVSFTQMHNGVMYFVSFRVSAANSNKSSSVYVVNPTIMKATFSDTGIEWVDTDTAPGFYVRGMYLLQ